jgi:hypothetical protein
MKKKQKKQKKQSDAKRRLMLEGIDIECTFEKDAKSGVIHMTFSDVGCEISQGDKKLGSIRGCIGGLAEINIDGYTYYLDNLTLWHAVAAAHEKWKKENKK